MKATSTPSLRTVRRDVKSNCVHQFATTGIQIVQAICNDGYTGTVALAQANGVKEHSEHVHAR
jgi:hypothetical protein